jgi:ATP-dependent Lon protease
MEIIELPGYTLREKQQIAARYLVPKQLAEHGLGNGQARVKTELGEVEELWLDTSEALQHAGALDGE